ncbi:MAG: hypothetical protein Q7K39_03815, partial [Candidatus Magasanikbacteria bacterium]|nr:hypothetical protein [Candidatus Magasanikbacteria bacterium]
GAGPEIISQQVTGQGADSTLSVLRNDAYCADEQSVVSEKSNGELIFGYCTEERRIWDFNAKSCAPLYNTCQTFASASLSTSSSGQGGQTNSYLENTLDFSFCNLGNAGCQRYAIAAPNSYDSTVKNVDWKKSLEGVHLNKQAESCDAESEGCRGLIRLNSGGGANLLKNSGFEEPLNIGGWSSFGTISAEGYQSGQSLNVTKGANRPFTLRTASYNFSGESFAISFYAKCAQAGTFSVGDSSLNLTVEDGWKRYSLIYPSSADEFTVTASFNDGSCLIDNIKLERSEQATNYSAYGTGSTGSPQAGPSLIYEKLMPSYLDTACIGANPPSVCSSFARKCAVDEAGCELFINSTGETKIPAKVVRDDYCPAECVGYNTFVQGETAFDTQRDAYFIPKTAKTCDAVASGCDQFTNLDEEKKGGESIGYYTYLRQCLKKSDNEASCGNFYTWEGSDESGFQLKTESLKLDDDGDDIDSGLPEWARYDGDPAVLSDDSAVCSEAVYNLPPSNPAYSADCRQFYNRLGGISYHLYSSTVSCTDDCHPYRRTALNTDENITEVNCLGSDKSWVSGQCVVCRNGGVWDPTHNGCIYMAVPSLGLTCAAQANGCREYSGNTGNNLRNIFVDDFSDGTKGSWVAATGVSGSAVISSNVAITLGPDNIGHSIKITNSAERPVGNAVRKGLDYVLKFVAKSESGTLNLAATLGDGAIVSQLFSTLDAASINLTPEWRIFEINLTNLDHSFGADEVLRLAAGGNFFINNITLVEITDRYYLIKNSWRTPDACYKDVAGVDKGILYNLGCDRYTDRASKVHNLRRFNKLCSESAVGCELMIDTQNSSGPAESFYEDGQSVNNCAAGAADCVTVPADGFVYAVYDSEKLCGAGEKGCERLGKPYKYETTTLYGDIYLKNNPDKYAQTLCGANAVGCETFAYNDGASHNGEKYFKDPGDMTCEWRKQVGSNASESWLKKKVKRCGGNAGAVCLADKDCSANVKCLLETDNKICPTSDIKTLGLGGATPVSQPEEDSRGTLDGKDDIYWTGVCAAADSGCTEYIDPLAKFNSNLIFNGSFQNLDGVDATVDGWGAGLTQSVTLEPNTAYRLGRAASDRPLTLNNCLAPNNNALYEIKNHPTLPAQFLDGPTNEIRLLTGAANSKIFYYKGAVSASCTIIAGNANGTVELKKVVIDYQLAQNLDKQTCNGIVNSGQGCVLFNERKQSGANLTALTWDADATGNGSAPVGEATPPGNALNDSNAILKVAPDRVCDKWLSCKSYIKDAKGNNICFDVGLCDGVNDNGDCQSFISSKKTNQIAGNLDISNLSGYSKVGLRGGSLVTDYYPFGAMEQAGEVANISNGGFEFYGSNLYPIGWSWGNQPENAIWDSSIFSVINNPIAVQREGIGYSGEGASFLKMGSSFSAVSEQTDVSPNTDYIITAYVNTKNLKSGQAKIDILKKDSLKNKDVVIADSIIKQDLGNDWNFQMGKFTTGPDDSQIKIKLYAALKDSGVSLAGSEGNFYFDDIKIRPALNSRIKLPTADLWYTPQSCRLYPQSDSLACDYYEDSGKRQKGWPGYCLEYDRRPGDPNTCLLW